MFGLEELSPWFQAVCGRQGDTIGLAWQWEGAKVSDTDLRDYHWTSSCGEASWRDIQSHISVPAAKGRGGRGRGRGLGEAVRPCGDDI